MSGRASIGRIDKMQTVTDAIPVPTFERHNTCLGCGYDLFGQPSIGVCPECGQSTRESARNAAFLDAPGNVARLRSGTVLLLWSSILAGLCPGICLLCVANDGLVILSFAVVMTLIFGATAVTASLGERQLASMVEFAQSESGDGESPSARPNVVGDLVAAAGLLSINIAAYVYAANTRSGSRTEYIVAALVGIGFGCLSATAWRAVPAYRMRMRVAEACLGGHHRGLAALGYTKAIYETIWLCCCWLAPALLLIKLEEVAVIFAFGALFGLGGFAILWVFMIVLHAVLLVKVRRKFGETKRGFEVVANPLSS
jgi:hypothetical protein